MDIYKLMLIDLKIHLRPCSHKMILAIIQLFPNFIVVTAKCVHAFRDLDRRWEWMLPFPGKRKRIGGGEGGEAEKFCSYFISSFISPIQNHKIKTGCPAHHINQEITIYDTCVLKITHEFIFLSIWKAEFYRPLCLLIPIDCDDYVQFFWHIKWIRWQAS